MKLEEAVRVYQECQDKPDETDCSTCPIGKIEFIGQIKLCARIAIADIAAKKIEPECQQDDCQERNNKNACCDCAGVSGYKSPQEKEI